MIFQFLFLFIPLKEEEKNGEDYAGKEGAPKSINEQRKEGIRRANIFQLGYRLAVLKSLHSLTFLLFF